MSRLDLAGITTVHHNVKVRSFGKVNDRSVREMLQQFDRVVNSWGHQPIFVPPGAPFVNRTPGQDDDEDSDEDEDDDDDHDNEDDDDDDEEEEESEDDAAQ